MISILLMREWVRLLLVTLLLLLAHLNRSNGAILQWIQAAMVAALLVWSFSGREP